MRNIAASKANQARLKEWLICYGLKVVRGRVQLYKCTTADGDPWWIVQSNELKPNDPRIKIHYSLKKTVIAPDWDGGLKRCGKGIHIAPTPNDACRYGCRGKRHKLFVVSAKLEDIAIGTFYTYANSITKVKARSCYVVKYANVSDGDPYRSSTL